MIYRFTRFSLIFVLIAGFGGSIFTSANLSFSDYGTTNQARINQDEPRTFSVMIFTFNGFFTIQESDQTHANDWKEVFKRENADIILSSEGSQLPRDDGTFQGVVDELNSFFTDETPYQGVSTEPNAENDGQFIISRFPIISHQEVEFLTLDDGSSLKVTHPVMHAVVDIYGLEVNLFTGHWACCTAYNKRIKEQDGMMNYMDNLGDVPIIYGADFNSDSPLDTGYLQPVYSSLTTKGLDVVTNSSNPKASTVHTWTDVFRTLNPYDPGWTYHDENYESRIDYLFVNKWLVDEMVRSEMITHYPEAFFASDHYPLVSTFNMDYETVDLKPPATVHDIIATVDIGKSESLLTWPEITDNDLFKYQIYRNVSSKACLISEIDSSSPQFLDGYLYEQNTLYEYHLATVDELGNTSPLSNPIYVNSSQSQIVRAEIPAINATGVSGGIQIDWEGSSNGGDDNTLIEVRKSSSLTADRQIVIRTSDTTSYFDPLPSAPAGLNIYYWARAINIVGSSFYSETATAITVAPAGNSLNTMSQTNTVLTDMQVAPVLHQNDDCPSPLNTIDLPTTSTSIETSTTTTSTASTPTSSEKSDEGDSPISFLFVTFAIFNLAVMMMRKNKKEI